MRSTRVLSALLVLLCTAAFFLSALPGTADLNVWKAWVDGLATEGFVAGYNRGTGHILHPPLGMLLLSASHAIPERLGVPDHVWPASGWTGFRLTLWVWLVLGALLAWRLTRNIKWALLFVLVFLLNSVVYGAFDLFGIPFWLLALHALAERRPGLASFWALVAVLIKFQFLIFLPFVALFLLRDLIRREPGETKLRAAPWQSFAPAVMLLVMVLAVVGQGTALALVRGLAHDTLSGYALNFGWILTWAMHLRWPESYGPLEDGLITVLRTRDTRVMMLVRIAFASSFLFALWRQWRGPHTVEHLLRCMLAGYLAYFLFNKGAHENHLVPAIAVAGYLAWRAPAWRPGALILAVAANLNMFFFYSLDGSDRGAFRVALGIDWSLPLAMLYVVVLGALYLQCCGLLPVRRDVTPDAAPVIPRTPTRAG